MKKTIITLFIVSVLTICAYANPTTVINDELRKSSIDTGSYIIGIGKELKTIPDAKEMAQEYARAHVSIQVLENIRDTILACKNKPGYKGIAEYYSSVAQKPKVQVELPGIDYVHLRPNYTDSYGNVYGIAYVKRAELKTFYTNKAIELRKEIETALNMIEVGMPKIEEVEITLKTYANYETLKEAELIVLGAEDGLKPDTTFNQLLDNKKMMRNHPQQYITNIVTDFYTEKYKIKSMADIATIIAEQFDVQEANPSKDTVQLDLFTDGISGNPGYKANDLLMELNTNLSTKWPIVLSTSMGGTHPMGLGSAKLRLTGTFWEMGSDKVTVRSTLRDVKNGEFKAAAVITFKKFP